MVALNVNGSTLDAEAAPDTPLLWVLLAKELSADLERTRIEFAPPARHTSTPCSARAKVSPAALWGEINLREGRVEQTNFDSYRLMRMSEVPKIDTFILPSTEAPGGIGEPATALVAPAVGNAVYTATGRRLRSLPFARHKLA